ncbi:lanthionine synthetase C family protein [Pseudoalteromonas sp. MMG005]|uniref:lanthionine synthetase C family protein n=1 Tax=Pseudoalteromonas sp. MMG005 TaxID=2822682 RepID=UPI001B3A3CEA|nr:lanthionine synthetase C family protein [Pseudoalteromonas sp. MMG005]MBQ4847152.1 lanthionine synthetase C family protein [Pseudoalteromonas sp. MMG005]
MTKPNHLSVPQNTKIHRIIRELANKVINHTDEVAGNGLLSGLAGHLLFLYNAHRFDPSLLDENKFTDKLELLQEGLAEQSFELSNGLAGQAWVLEYLNQANQDDYDADLLEDVDALFVESLAHNPWLGEIEMVLGLSGYAPYAARRARFTDQTELYTVIVNGLASVSTKLDNGHITWSQPSESVYRFDKDEDSPRGPEYNLGLAHGVPGIIAALLPAVHIPKLKEQVTELLLGGCDWLLEQQNPDKAANACFGSCAGEGYESRLGWCYGDLTIALTLARVGKAIDRPHYVEQALEIAIHSAQRDAESGHIIDAGLCHGFVGLVTIYQLLNHIMPHPVLSDAMNTWLEYSLKQYDERGIEALYSFNGLDKTHSEDFGFLMGYAGIGIGLISFLDDDVSWSDCLLMS